MSNHTKTPEQMHALVADMLAAQTDAEKIVLIEIFLQSFVDDFYASEIEEP